MKRALTSFSFIFLFTIMANAGTDKNPVLTNTFTVSSGNIMVADTWNELKKTSISIEDVSAMQKEIKEQKKLIDELIKQNKDMKKEQDDLKRKVADMERKIQNK